MPSNADPEFEVATVKLTPSDERRSKVFTLRGGNFVTVGTTLNDLITFAYNLHPRQITDGPAWLNTQKYDLNGKPEPEGLRSRDQAMIMLQKLVASRFDLSFHHAKKELAVYALVVGKGGPKLTASADQNGIPGLGFSRPGMMSARNSNMSDFVGLMQSVVLDRPVVDQTGLSGRFDFQLTWTPDEFQFPDLGPRPHPAADEAAAPDLFTAIQQQLGLRLESVKAPSRCWSLIT